MTRLLALHTDYSLWESYERLDQIERIVNPDFEHVLVDNAVNSYCRSHQYEAAAFWWEPLALKLADEVERHLKAEDRGALDHDSLVAESKRRHEEMLKSPLKSMRPTAPRTRECFVEIMKVLSGPVEGAF